METMVGAASHRESCMDYLWERIQNAWGDGDAIKAHHLHDMYSSLERMSDEDYADLVTCNCEECTCAS